MVNKIVKVGNQIVSLGGGIINTPNPELEVQDINHNAQTSGLCGSKINKGDFILKFDTVLEEKHTSHITNRNPFCYHARFFVIDDELCCEVWGSGIIEVYSLRNGKWVGRSGRDAITINVKSGYVGTRTSTWGGVHDYNGTVAYAVGNHNRDYGRWPNFWAVRGEDGKWSQEPPMGMDQIDSWTNPEVYATSDTYEQRRQIDSGSVFQDSSGNAYGAFSNYSITTYTDEAYESNFSGVDNFKTYSIEVSSGRWTETTHDTSSPGRYVIGIDFIEVSGSVYLITGYEDRYLYNTSSVPNEELNSSHWYSHFTIYKWNPSTQNWDFYQFNRGVRAGSAPLSFWSQHLDASTHIFEHRLQGNNWPEGTGGVPMKYEASSGYFKNWGYFDRRELPYAANYTTKTFKYDDEYYIFLGGSTQHRTTLEGSSYGLTPGSTGQGQHRDYMDGTTYEEEKYAWLRLFKYNPSTTQWERQHYDDLYVSHWRLSPGELYSTMMYVRGVDAYEYEGKVHLVSVMDSYNQDSLVFFEFDGSSVTREDSTNYMPALACDYLGDKADEITQSGTIYRILRYNHYPYQAVLEFDLSGDTSGYWRRSRYMQDTNGSYLYGPRWYESSNGELYILAGHNNATRLILYQYDKQVGQLKKLSNDYLTTSATLPTANVSTASRIFQHDSKTYFTIGQGYGLNYIWEVVEDASGIPNLRDTTDIVLPTLQGGTIPGWTDEVIEYGGKIWYAKNNYNTPYYGPQIERLDSGASAFTEIDLATPRYVTSAFSGYEPYRTNNFFSRSYMGIGWVEFKDNLHLITENDAWPYWRIFEYNSVQDKFIEVAIGDFGYRPSNHTNGHPIRPVVWQNKIWWIDPYYGNVGTDSSHLLSWDGSGAFKQYAANDLEMNQQWGHDGIYWPWVNPLTNELEIHGGRQTSRNDSLIAFKVNQKLLDYGGKVWHKPEMGPPLRKTTAYGIALESGEKDDIIQIRKVRSL
jgi:hypothetical protein